MDRERFEELVLEALEELPERFRESLANVDIEVKDWPSAEELRSAGIPFGGMLLGVYLGVPHTRRARRYHLALPDRILIYQRPIERMCSSDDEIKERLRQVLRHEIGHHFGLAEADLRETSAG